MKQSGIDGVQCPRCAKALDLKAANIVCGACGQAYPQLGSIPVLLRKPELYLESCRRQLGLLHGQAARSVRTIEEELRRPGVTPRTEERLRATIGALRDQTADICAILQPIVGEPPAESASEEIPAMLKYVHNLYRDWGWPADPDGENERALHAVNAVLGGRPPGRTLVLGGGACRLAYDLHLHGHSSESVVVDIDPLLFSAAHTVIRGGSLRIREANAEIAEIGHAVREWRLAAPHGALDENEFKFVFADGRDPPFAAETFDTIVTPWFIDVVPSDVRDLISSVYRLLKSGGRWVNLGPLHYRRETPVSRRFSREEIFDLVQRAGFVLNSWRTDSTPYLVSKLNGRGKVEWVLTFAATKNDWRQSRAEDETPAWLLFSHIPIPVFPGLRDFHSDDPAEQLVANAIDGGNTIRDIAAILADHAGETGLTTEQFHEIVRRCLELIGDKSQ